MIAIIDYNMGNLLSVSKAFESLGATVRVIDRPAEAADADALVLPGVGNFGDGMEHLRSRGFEKPVKDFAESGKPLLGICLGMQMMLESSEEAPEIAGLGLFKGKVVRFSGGSGEKIPHMGWNSVKIVNMHPCLKDVADGSFFYFVHSYYASPLAPESTAGSCEYINEFTAILARDNIFATQFHPEKSQDAGLKILENFIVLSKQ